ncbi:hypothetical protein NDU88_001047 [Pleurodeles waltl]|uniref:Uncharacterized protein n=1 Tax=Pleurodeles waltl TaxID=8319 RepID=A0AAV7VXX6_PLEWA|nr:hypothetical protein NDU88_001047 [Pleurodeles waltl]
MCSPEGHRRSTERPRVLPAQTTRRLPAALGWGPPRCSDYTSNPPLTACGELRHPTRSRLRSPRYFGVSSARAPPSSIVRRGWAPRASLRSGAIQVSRQFLRRSARRRLRPVGSEAGGDGFQPRSSSRRLYSGSLL